MKKFLLDSLQIQQVLSLVIYLTSGNNVLQVTLTGTGMNIIHSYTAFNQQPLGFGGGFNQSSSQVFSLHGDMSNIDKVKMFLQIDCPSSGCDDWDRFANVKVKDPITGSWFEIGRYITLLGWYSTA